MPAPSIYKPNQAIYNQVAANVQGLAPKTLISSYLR